ncbi:MAG: 2-amino-4-hydroxy-6-hydroxymethyldihydropteridine diphosphokinase [Rudaea sp.]
MTRVYLSLGSNIDAQRHLTATLDDLRERFGDIEVSPAYRFAAVGFDGPSFINLAVAINTTLEPEALNEWLHELEHRHGRDRDAPRFSSRTIDVDIVLYGERVVEGQGHLQIPRPELGHAFVLQPLADIAAAVSHPVSGISIEQLWRDCGESPGEPCPL